MIRSTAISTIDQAILSAINFLSGLLLIRFATQEEYGLFTQLIGMQSLFSVLHAGMFVSAYLALLPRYVGAAREEYRAGMARGEAVLTLASTLLVALATWLFGKLFGHSLTLAVSIAAAVALLGLWWREFVRAGYFGDVETMRVLRLDASYAVLVVAGFALVLWMGRVTATSVLLCSGFAGVLVAAIPVLRKARSSAIGLHAVRASLKKSWQSAKWEVSTSIVTWGHAQTFVFFAAIQGGLRAAAEISAARMLTMPLAMLWAAYANVLRPSASRLINAENPRVELTRIARGSVGFVIGVSGLYFVVLYFALPVLDQLLFDGRFAHVSILSKLWLVYFAVTGLTTVATSILRSALEFRNLFQIHLLCAIVAVCASALGLLFSTPSIFVVALIAVEILLMSLCWRLLWRHLAAIPHVISSPG